MFLLFTDIILAIDIYLIAIVFAYLWCRYIQTYLSLRIDESEAS